MKKSAIISKLILLVLFLTHNVILAQNQVVTVNGSQIQVSSTLQSVLNQVESIYLKPISGIELSNYLNRAPVFVPMFIGLVMQRQEMIMRENITEEHLNNFTAFEEEIFAFLEQLAEAHNNSSPVDNSFMPSARLKVLYQDALKGNQNEVCKNDFGINPATIETAYLLEGFSARIYGALIIEDEEPTEINLFGEVAPAAEHTGNSVKITKSSDKSFQMEGGCECPVSAAELMKTMPNTLTGADGISFYLDCNGNLYDYTYVLCRYSPTMLLLQGQSRYIDGKKNGKEYDWIVSGDGTRRLWSEIDYVNGLKHGIKKSWVEDEKPGSVYLYWEGQYVNDKLHGIVVTYYPNGKIMSRSRYSNGKHIENFR